MVSPLFIFSQTTKLNFFLCKIENQSKGFFLDYNNLTKKIYEANHQLESPINVLWKDEIEINKSNTKKKKTKKNIIF
jgi:hypothetical protein